MSDSWCAFDKSELWVYNLHISEYSHGGHYNQLPKAPRKLLLTKRKLRKLEWWVKEKGVTIVPTLLWINEKGYAKLDIALAKGKRSYDKRESLKEKENQRELSRFIS